MEHMKKLEPDQRFREEVYLTAMAALIHAHPDWLEASVVTSAERFARMSSRPTATHAIPEILEVAA